MNCSQCDRHDSRITRTLCRPCYWRAKRAGTVHNYPTTLTRIDDLIEDAWHMIHVGG